MVPHCAQVTGSLGPGFAVAALKRVPLHCGHLRVSLICVIGLPLRFPFPLSVVSRFPFPGFVSHPRAPKPSPTPLARRQLRHLLELHQLHPLKHELRDPRPARHHHRLFAQVDHWDH